MENTEEMVELTQENAPKIEVVDNETEFITVEQKKADIAEREQKLRDGIEALIKEHQITLDAQLQVTNKGIVPGIIMVDLKFNEGLVGHIA